MTLKRLATAILSTAIVAAMIGVGIHVALAQPPAGVVEAKMIAGKVVEPILNDQQDGDGWKLDSGDTIHVPPAAFAELQNTVKPGEMVHAATRPKTLRDGRQVNEVITLQVGDRHLAIMPPAPPAPPHKKPHPHPEPQQEEPMKAQGTITTFNTNHRGDVDGFTLDDNTEVKFPPHVGESLQEGMEVGTEVSVKGHRHETPDGDIHLHAEEITAAGYTYTIDHPKPPKPPKHGPGHEDWMSRKQADEVLMELRSIRKLLEQRG